MPIKETLDFDAEAYKAIASNATIEWLQQQEVATMRKSVSSGYGTASAAAGSAATGGILVLLAIYKGRSLSVAHRKFKIVRAELTRRGVAHHHAEPADIIRPLAVGILGTMIGQDIGDFVGDHSGLAQAAADAHLPPGASPSTGLLDDPGAAADGVGGAIENLFEAGNEAMAAAADPIAYHAGMVQAQTLFGELGASAAEALLGGSAQPNPECHHSRGVTQTTCISCKSTIEQGTYWRKSILQFSLPHHSPARTNSRASRQLSDCCSCDRDTYDLCSPCHQNVMACGDTRHGPMRMLQVPSGPGFVDRLAATTGYELWKPASGTALPRSILRDSPLFCCHDCHATVSQGRIYRAL